MKIQDSQLHGEPSSLHHVDSSILPYFLHKKKSSVHGISKPRRKMSVPISLGRWKPVSKEPTDWRIENRCPMNNISNSHIELGGLGIGRRKFLDYEMSNWAVPVKASFMVDRVKWSKSPRRQSSRLPRQIFLIQSHDCRILCLIKSLWQKKIADTVCFQLSSIFTQKRKRETILMFAIFSLLGLRILQLPWY